MIVVRNVFQLEFGKAKEAKALINENQKLMKKYELTTAKFMTDLTGTFYTVVMEISYESLADYERASEEVMGRDEFAAWYKRFVPLVRSGYREIFSVMS
jgi:hypothetical protein